MKEKIGKKGFKKRLFSVVFALAIVISLMPVTEVMAGIGTDYVGQTLEAFINNEDSDDVCFFINVWSDMNNAEASHRDCLDDSISKKEGASYSAQINSISWNKAGEDDYANIFVDGCRYQITIWLRTSHQADTSHPNICKNCGKRVGGSTPSQGTFEHPHDKEQNNFASGGLVGSPNEIMNAVLTETEKQEFAAGGNYSVWLELGKKEANNVDDAEKQKINAKLPGGFSVGTYLDIQLKKQGPGDDEGKLVTNTPGNVTIKLTVPTELQKAGRKYNIIRYHGDEATVLDAKLSDGYVLTFATNGFSTYALIYSDATPASAPVTSPKTGETSNMPLVMLVLSLGVVGLGLTSRKKITK